MKTIKLLALFITGSVLLASCSSDDDNPEVINEEELITTMTVTLIADNANDVVLEIFDEDGQDGPAEPNVKVSGSLKANTTYAGTVQLENETEDPAEDITEEVKEEADEHQFFFAVTGNLNTPEYDDTENDYLGNGSDNYVGIKFLLTTTEPGEGTFKVTLIHEPKKPNNGISDAGGETDATATFPVNVE
ncbi:type 1 periplasmic binding fold superfamily protein [Sinomicrobium weinanense]|uniref:Type 1 periplasmic binding fold superfamily protein n=1 Tax=Sinomicrobium weinanense TaxID=2842200 RepID=A0A926JSV2_9FLAO|nr:type 1 periplasmic binding fold superfamily protein [Sinomicrobium weinanense]MBC9796880.1 type 1 periplasmic binding fold superfamily protein [Sinomicrobium weinanense]MBU3123869.1 type 1 periplasmic binding fold superfamily protein [Sinomicrobium weinanense]